MWDVVITSWNGTTDAFSLGSGEVHQLFEFLVVTLDKDKVQRVSLENSHGVIVNTVYL